MAIQRSPRLGMIVLAAVGMAAAACTAIANTKSSQCHSQDDCLSRGPEFADTTCGPDRVCIPISVPSALCQTNGECIDAIGGAPATCLKGKCVGLIPPACTRVLGDKEDLLDDNSIYFGLVGPADINLQLIEQAVELARTQIKKQLAGGLPPATPGGPKRPLVILDCPAEPNVAGLSSPRNLTDALTFMQNTVGVPVQLGGLTSAWGLPVASFSLDHNTVNFNAQGDPGITFLQHKDLVYRLSFSDAQSTQIVVPLLNQYLVPWATTAGILGAGEALRIAIVSEPQTPRLQGIAKALDGATPPIPYRAFDIGNANDRINNPDPTGQFARAIVDIQTYAPHIILWSTGTGSINNVALSMWKTWPSATPKPLQVGLSAPWETALPTALATIDDTWRQRFVGTKVVGVNYSQDDFNVWVAAFKQKFPESALQTPSILTAEYYDAMYMATYAIVAIGDQVVNGTNVGKGMRSVADASGGVPIRWGSESLNDGIAALVSGKHLSYQGVTGHYLFDGAGDHPGDMKVFCLTQAAGKANGSADTGFGMDGVSQQPTGTLDLTACK
jgi:hypothetical protein